MTLVGAVEKIGTYEGREYHNIILHCTEPFGNELGVGVEVSSHKIKAKVLMESLGKHQIGMKDIKAFIGQEVKCFYDKYGNVSFVVLGGVPTTQAFPQNCSATGFGKSTDKSN